MSNLLAAVGEPGQREEGLGCPQVRARQRESGEREFLTVEVGQVRLESGTDADELKKGDSATYRADVPHAIVNAGRGEAVVFLVVIYR